MPWGAFKKRPGPASSPGRAAAKFALRDRLECRRNLLDASHETRGVFGVQRERRATMAPAIAHDHAFESGKRRGGAHLVQVVDGNAALERAAMNDELLLVDLVTHGEENPR